MFKNNYKKLKKEIDNLKYALNVCIEKIGIENFSLGDKDSFSGYIFQNKEDIEILFKENCELKRKITNIHDVLLDILKNSPNKKVKLILEYLEQEYVPESAKKAYLKTKKVDLFCLVLRRRKLLEEINSSDVFIANIDKIEKLSLKQYNKIKKCGLIKEKELKNYDISLIDKINEQRLENYCFVDDDNDWEICQNIEIERLIDNLEKQLINRSLENQTP